ncbi:MAG: GGDEF domain-containing protein [Deltaproteobacteria bacterium]|nr:GGDEF domain-containing protein [Deltaproteobacteria bacterium]
MSARTPQKTLPPETARFAVVFPDLDAHETEVRPAEVADIPALGVRDRASITLMSGANAGQFFSLEKNEAMIGRDVDADIRLEDAGISRRHARIQNAGEGRYVLEDLGSSNGTYIGGKPVRRHELTTGDRIQFGPRTLMRFALLDEAEELLQRQLFESSIRDALTGAFNKAYMTERLEAELAHARRHKSALAVLVFDLDEFKKTNDVHGHLVGDLVLRTVAQRVHTLIRVEDVFARFGGEEFVVLIRGTSDGVRLAERIRAGVEELEIVTEGVRVKATVSVGVASLAELEPNAEASDLLHEADTRLLNAKRAGRNQVCST